MNNLGNKFPTEVRNAEQIVKRAKKDLAWVVVSVAAALAAAVATHMYLVR